MTRLSSLPFLSQRCLEFLASHGIDTVEAFLVRDFQLQAWLEKNPEFEEQAQAISSYLKSLHGGFHSGSSLQKLQQMLRFLPTGCGSLDGMLQGGLLEGTVTELVGASSSGKTQLCMQAAATVAYQTGTSVAYVDTSNSFSARRIAHMLGGILGTPEKIKDAQVDLERVMKNISVCRIFNIYSLFSLIQELDAALDAKAQETQEHPKLSLLIVDSASSLVSPILGGKSHQGHALMLKLGFMLKRIAHTQNLAVLTTNHTVGGEEGQTKPALGESWKSVPHVRILLERDAATLICRATVVKHTSMVTGMQATFRLGRAGLKPLDEFRDDLLFASQLN